MSKLLHSKTFRDNLFKWIILYVCVLLMLTAVVTYSKYISRASGQSDARVSKFNVEIKKDSVCSATSGLCGLDSYKPYDTLEYNFSVDPSEAEVTTDIVVVATLTDNTFELIDIYDENNDNTLDATAGLNDTTGDTTITYENSRFTINLKGVKASDTTVRNYKIKIKLASMSSTNLESFYKNVHTYDEIIILGYNATQVD